MTSAHLTHAFCTVRTTFMLFFLVAVFHPAFDPLFQARAQEELHRRQEELEGLRAQIRALEEKSKEQQKNESETLELVDTYDRNAGLLRQLISRLKAEERRLQTAIDTTQTTLRTLERQLAFLKDHYKRYVRSIYRSGRYQEAELLLTATSWNQFAVRNEYLKRFTEQRRRDAERIASKTRQVETSQVKAQRQLNEERRLIAEKGAEEDRLAALASDRRETLDHIRKDKKLLERQMQRQLRAARDMEQMIADLVEQDRIKKEHAAAEKKVPHLPQPPSATGDLEARKGKLRWPVAEGSVVAHFGPQRHPTLRTVTTNTGIDIAVETGTTVTAVAGGEVATINYLPSYGNLVILNHQNGFRTVYTHLGEISVAPGQVIEEGAMIGTSGDSIDGPRLHFEIWKDREKQNPELWLSRQ
jgi:septal ring factor EnvC (AmiA/AmiB activator)